MPSQSDIEHLLRRTEFVARPERVSALTPLSTIAGAVDSVLAVSSNPGTLTFTETADWQRGQEYTKFWLNRMAHDSPRPIQEKMAFFWHGHFCSDRSKVGSMILMREQLDAFRFNALGNLRSLATTMSTQVAMLRYLDNNQNKQTSPNQNFARELMELFLLGVGNYTEADVEAATAAWTGHTDDWKTDQYLWRADWHDTATKQFLGRTINQGGDVTKHGAETINVILGNGVVPSGATVVANRGRPTNAVAAEFISKKLWIEFAGTDPSPTVIAALRDVALANDFAVKPWLKALLTRPEFYSAEVKQGLVRSPVEMMVALLAATGLRAADAPLWLMEGMGQAPLYPPNVSGWKHNSYWVSASAMAQRAAAARSLSWRTMTGFWEGDGLIHLGAGTVSKQEMEVAYRDNPSGLVDRIVALMRLKLAPSTLSALKTYASRVSWWQRVDLIVLILLTPDVNVA